MTASIFFDTSVLVYAAVGSGRDEPKRKRALELIESASHRPTGVDIESMISAFVVGLRGFKDFVQPRALDLVFFDFEHNLIVPA